MKNFGRVLQLALRYRLTLCGIVISSLAVAVLWGMNIGFVYPFVEVVFEGKSLHEWADREIAKTSAKVGELELALAEPSTGPNPGPDHRESIESRLAAERQALAIMQWLQPLIHAYLPNDPFRTLMVVVLTLFVGTAIKDAFLVADLVLVERLVQLAMFDLRKLCFRSALRLDVKSFGEHGTSTLLSRFTYDAGNVSSGLTQLFGNAIREPLKMLACLIGASLICWQLLVFSLILVPLALFLIKRLSQSIKRANRRAMEEMSRIYNVLNETFSGIQTVKAFTMERHERNRFHGTAKQFLKNAMRIIFYNALTKPITEILGIGVISLALVTGAYLALTQKTEIFGITMCNRPLDPKLLFVFYGLLAGVSDPARKLTEVFSAIQGAVAASDRVFMLLDSVPDIMDPIQPQPLPERFRKLVFEDVSFHYTPDRPVLKNFTLEIPFGERLAIVGPNGCGKTTLVNLLPRFFDPVSGHIRMDGVDLRDVRLRDIRGQIGLVTQHTQLFDDTVLNNIRYGSPQATDDDVMEAAKKAFAHQFITDKLEHGYQTRVGQGGCKLSGGQRQRIALARAILRDPHLLILDEATSQVDLESEQLIHRVLERFIHGRTAIMTTHRLSTLTLANRILVMDAGNIVDVGTHEELLRRCELYQRLHEIQFRQTA